MKFYFMLFIKVGNKIHTFAVTICYSTDFQFQGSHFHGFPSHLSFMGNLFQFSWSHPWTAFVCRISVVGGKILFCFLVQNSFQGALIHQSNVNNWPKMFNYFINKKLVQPKNTSMSVCVSVFLVNCWLWIFLFWS